MACRRPAAPARAVRPAAAARGSEPLLPDELLAAVLRWLPPGALLAAARVCRQWARLAASPCVGLAGSSDCCSRVFARISEIGAGLAMREGSRHPPLGRHY